MVRHKQRNIAFYSLLLFLSILCLLPGCDRQEQPATNVHQGDKSFQTYRIGLFPEHNLFDQKKRYDPLMSYLSKHLGVNLQGVVLPGYGSIIENFDQLNLDGAFLGSLNGAIAIKVLQIEPLARPQYSNGESSYYGMVFARKGSAINSAKDLFQKKVAFVDCATSAGYLVPVAYFRELGIKDYRNWFSESYFSGTHEDAIYDVLNGLADIGAAKNTVFYRLAETDRRLIEKLEILKTSPPFPANGLAMLKDIPGEIKQGLVEKLLTMHLNSEGRQILNGLRIERFINTSTADYQTVFDYANSIDEDLTNCQYTSNYR